MSSKTPPTSFGAIALVLLIAASCGPSGGTTSMRLSAAQQLEQAAARQLLLASGETYTPFGDIPTTGAVQYDGFFLARLSDDEDSLTDTLSAEMEAEIDFSATEMLTGRTQAIYDATGNLMEGQLDLTGGLLDRNGDPTLDATFFFLGVGDLVDHSGRTLETLINFEGDFRSSRASVVAGALSGRVVTDNQEQATSGTFVLVER